MRAAIVRTQHDGVHCIDAISVGRIHGDAAEIPATLPDAEVTAGALPMAASIVGAIQAAGFAIDECIHTRRRTCRQCDTDAADVFRKTIAANLRPVLAAIAGFVQARTRAAGRRIDIPGRAPRLPHRGVDHLRITGLERQINRAGGIALTKHALPMRATIARTKHAAFGIRPVRMAKRSHEYGICIMRIDDNLADLLAVGQTNFRPGFSGIAGTIHAITLSDVGAHVGLTAADVNYFRIGRCNRQRANRTDRLLVENRLPGAASIECFPDAAIDGAEIEMLRLPGHARNRQYPPAPEWPKQTPMQVAVVWRCGPCARHCHA